jgi:hypothetical protein
MQLGLAEAKPSDEDDSFPKTVLLMAQLKQSRVDYGQLK